MSNLSVQPIFSVIIPVYNTAKYINECIDSVLQQCFTNFEIICVNDGSSDNSVALIEQYQDSRIHLINQENRGLSGARNTGINASRGIFIAFLDSDDFWAPNKLKRHFEHLVSNPTVGVSFSASCFIDERSTVMGIGQHPQLTNISAKDIFCRNPIGNGSAPVVRKSLLIKIGRCIELSSAKGNKTRIQYFDETMRQSEDVDLWLRIALTTDFTFEGIAEELTYYRIHSSGLSADLEKQYLAWLFSVTKNKSLSPAFFKQWFSLASAYQKRYLARRAIQSGNQKHALMLMHRALKEDIRILLNEPARTSLTYLCALLAFLPKRWYQALEKKAMQHANILRSPS